MQRLEVVGPGGNAGLVCGLGAGPEARGGDPGPCFSAASALVVRGTSAASRSWAGWAPCRRLPAKSVFEVVVGSSAEWGRGFPGPPPPRREPAAGASFVVGALGSSRGAGYTRRVAVSCPMHTAGPGSARVRRAFASGRKRRRTRGFRKLGVGREPRACDAMRVACGSLMAHPGAPLRDTRGERGRRKPLGVRGQNARRLGGAQRRPSGAPPAVSAVFRAGAIPTHSPSRWPAGRRHAQRWIAILHFSRFATLLSSLRSLMPAMNPSLPCRALSAACLADLGGCELTFRKFLMKSRVPPRAPR